MNYSFAREPMASQPISMLAPLHNVASRLPRFLEEAKPVLAGLSQPYELLLIDEGSSDGTVEIAETAAAGWPQLRLVRQSAFVGEGHAVQVGLAEARHPLIFILPPRAGISPAVLPSFLAEIDSVDCVAGVRAGLGRWQRFWSGGSGWWLFGVRLADAACPARLYRKSLFRWPLQSQGPFIHLEIAAKANFAGCLMNEVEIPFNPADEVQPIGEPNAWRELSRLFNQPRFHEKSAHRGHDGLDRRAAVEPGS